VTSNGLWNGKSLERLHGIQERKASLNRMMSELALMRRSADSDYDRELCYLLGVEEGTVTEGSTACEESPNGHCVTELALGGPGECLICKHPAP
jgi:hypothetical protein